MRRSALPQPVRRSWRPSAASSLEKNEAKRKQSLALTVLVLTAVFAAVALAVTAFAGLAQLNQEPAAAAQEIPAGIAQIPLADAVVFRDTRATADYGKVAWVPLDGPRGERTTADLSCDRVYRTGGTLFCLSVTRGMNTSYGSAAYGIGGQRLAVDALPGEPSRTPVSATGMVGVTAFITGESYEQVGFSTRTTIATPGGKDYGNLQDFTIKIGDQVLTAEDRNVWGVTFAKDGNTF